MSYDTDADGIRWGIRPRNLVPTGLLNPFSSSCNALRIQAEHDLEMAELVGRGYRASDPRLAVAS